MKRPPTAARGLARVWFPLALVALLLLAIPGFVLFALNVFGLENAVNTWLQDHIQLTYHLSIPWWAGLILLLVPLLILLLYFLKLKRKPLQVPSTFLWKKSIEDLHVNALFQWLRENVLLLLQLLTVLLLIYALMAFQLHGNMIEGKHYILMIDNSASMSATDVSPSRLDLAKEQAINEIRAHTDNDTGMVIVFNSSAQILQSYTRDRSLLEAAVRSIEPTQRPTRLEEALSLAESLANPTRSTEDAASQPGADAGPTRAIAPAEGISTEVHLFSDGRFPDVSDFALGNLALQYHPIGQRREDGPVDNAGLVTLNAVRDDSDPTKLRVFARALNYRPTEMKAQVQLEVRVNGELRGIYSEPAEEKLTIPAARSEPIEEGKEDSPRRDVPGEGTFTFRISDIDDRATVIMHAQLVGPKDRFALDDEAWLVVGVVRRARVLVVTSENRLLNAFFDSPATEKVAQVSYLTPEDLKDRAKYLQPAREGAWDLVVFDRCAPEKEEDMPSANTFFIGEVPPPWKTADMPRVRGPIIEGWQAKSPIMTYLRGLQEIGIAEAFRFSFKDRDGRDLPRVPRLLETRDTALVFALNTRQAYTDLVQAFAILDDRGLFNTTWPLHPSFPLYLRNIIYALGNVSDAAGEENVQPGQVKTLRPDVGIRQIEVTDPQGRTEKLERGTRPDFSYGRTDQVGIYRVHWDGQEQRSFAVNLLDADESNIEPRADIKIGDETIEAGKSRGQPRDTWKWIALAALVLLMLEWWIYNKRVYV